MNKNIKAALIALSILASMALLTIIAFAFPNQVITAFMVLLAFFFVVILFMAVKDII